MLYDNLCSPVDLPPCTSSYIGTVSLDQGRHAVRGRGNAITAGTRRIGIFFLNIIIISTNIRAILYTTIINNNNIIICICV